MKMTVVEQIYKDIENTFSIHDPVRKYFESRKQEWLQKEKAQQEAFRKTDVVEQNEKCSGCEESTGETKLWCCNHCGKRIEDF